MWPFLFFVHAVDREKYFATLKRDVWRRTSQHGYRAPLPPPSPDEWCLHCDAYDNWAFLIMVYILLSSPYSKEEKIELWNLFLTNTWEFKIDYKRLGYLPHRMIQVALARQEIKSEECPN